MSAPCWPRDIRRDDPNWSQDVITNIWAQAKARYIDQGKNFDETVLGLAKDLGTRPEWVSRALTKPKAIRQITNELYGKMYNRRRAVSQARQYVENLDTPAAVRAAANIARVPFAAAVYGHGTVAMQTHAGALLFRPTMWDHYFTNLGRSAVMWRSPKFYEKMVRQTQSMPRYVEAQRAGLANDFNKTYTDYGWIGRKLGRLGEPGQRGFGVLKVLRQELYNHYIDKVSPELALDKDYQKGIAQIVNESTGVIKARFGETGTSVSNLVLFAAKLEASRWIRTFVRPAETIGTITKKVAGGNVPAAEWGIALQRMKNAAGFAATYYGSLLVNNAILQWAGSKDRVNLTDIGKADWLMHKGPGGWSLVLEGRLLAPLRLVAQVLAVDLRSKEGESAAAKRMYHYLSNRFSPAAQIVKEQITGVNWQGRPVPSLRGLAGIAPITKKPSVGLGEYALSHGPIPLSGATGEIYKTFREEGMSANQASTYIRALAVAGTEATGVGLRPPYEPTQKLIQPKPSRAQPSFQQAMRQFKKSKTGVPKPAY